MSGDITKIKTLPCYVYYNDVNLGYTDAPVEFAAEVVKKDITADQKGEEVIVQIIQGSNLTVKTTLKEFDRTVIDELYKDAGLASEYTDTTGGSSTAVLGFGSANVGQNLSSLAKPLKLVPIDDDESANIVYCWLASPTPGSLNYSGVDETMIEVEWNILEDSTKPDEINKAFIGDPAEMTTYIS